MAPQISLPWVSAFTITCGPGLPLSNVWTYSVPVADCRCAAVSGAVSSTGMAGLVSVLMAVVMVVWVVVMVVRMVVALAGMRAALARIVRHLFEQPREI